MKKAVLLLLMICSLPVFSQEKSHNLGDITGTDSVYIWSPFRANGTVFAFFDFTNFSTDSVELDLYYVIKNEANELKYIPIEAGFSPLTLVKATYQTIANGDTTHMVGVKITDSFFGDRFAYKLTPHDAASTDILKVYIRK